MRNERIRLDDGRLWVWDDEPAELFGQIWMPVCLWCHAGPLNDGEVLCGGCGAELEEGPR